MARPNNGPRLVKNDRGVYEIRWTDNRRSMRLSTRTDDLQEAQRFFAGWLNEAQRVDQAGKTVTVADVLARYTAGHLPTVADPARQELALRWLGEGLGELAVDEIDDRTLAEYSKRRAAGKIGKRKAAPGTLRRELNVFVAALNYARKQRLISADQVPHVALPAAPPPKEVWLDEAEAAQLLDAASVENEDGRMSRAWRFVAIALAVGPRKGVVERLQWQHVDLAAGLIRFDKVYERQTAKRRVPVPIPDWLRPLLERAKREAQSDHVLDHAGSVRRAVQWAADRAYKATGNAKFLKVTPHVLRHSAATLMMRAGIPAWEVAGVLGDTLATVMKTYAHHAPQHLRSAVNAIDPTRRKAG